MATSYITASETAKKWNITQRRVQKLCMEGRIPNVFKLGDSWAIPSDAKKPKDARLSEHEEIVVNFIDLFCGCGGFSQGFSQAGCIPKLGIDIWKDATNTYKYNFPDASIINKDITKVTTKELLETSGLRKQDIDVIIGGPPCQGFSISGKRITNDPRNILYKSFVNFVGDIKPKIFIMENVPGLVSMDGGAVKNAIYEDFSSRGYNVSIKILSTDDYGVPQHRKRVFFVGLSKKYFGDKYFTFPRATTIKKVTCKEAISDLDFISETEQLSDESEYKIDCQSEYQKLMRKDSEVLWNHVATIHSEQTRNIIAMVPDGGNYKSLPKELWDTRKVHIAWTRMNSEKPCFTIDTGHNHHFHYRANRVPTARESARIQSIPDRFRILGNKTSQLKQIGNAVPPLLAEAIANKIVKTIKEGKNV